MCTKIYDNLMIYEHGINRFLNARIQLKEIPNLNIYCKLKIKPYSN